MIFLHNPKLFYFNNNFIYFYYFIFITLTQIK